MTTLWPTWFGRSTDQTRPMVTPRIHAPPQTMRTRGRVRGATALRRGPCFGAAATFAPDHGGGPSELTERFLWKGCSSPRSGGSSSSEFRPPLHHWAALWTADADD